MKPSKREVRKVLKYADSLGDKGVHWLRQNGFVTAIELHELLGYTGREFFELLTADDRCGALFGTAGNLANLPDGEVMFHAENCLRTFRDTVGWKSRTDVAIARAARGGVFQFGHQP